MPLMNCKVLLKLSWIEDCILSSAGNSAKCAITDTNLHVPIVTLCTKDSANLAKQKNLKDLFIKIVMKQNLLK